MSIAITDEHRALAQTVSDFLDKNGARTASRALLTAENEELPAFWGEVGQLGWLGLHLPEEHGGSGFGLPELVIVAEEMGRAVAPGPFVPTVIASAVLATAGLRADAGQAAARARGRLGHRCRRARRRCPRVRREGVRSGGPGARRQAR